MQKLIKSTRKQALEMTEWNIRAHQYFFATKSKFILGISSTSNLPPELKSLIDVDSPLCLDQETDHFKRSRQKRIGKLENFVNYSEMHSKFYIEQLVILSKAYVEDTGILPNVSWNLSRRVEQIHSKMKDFDNGKGYQLNIDNFIKLMLILQKARNRLPIIIMGETGCGKTYLIQFLVQVILFDVSLLAVKTMHFGVDIQEFADYVQQGIDSCADHPDKSVWLFMDEFNTSKLQAYVNQMMHDRLFIARENSRAELPENMMLVSVCNPYQIRNENRDRQNHVIDAHPEKKNVLSHQVLPIPTRMLYGLWDFGALDTKIERKYIDSILNDLNMGPGFMQAFAGAVNKCQEFIRETVEKNNSSVSLRDIQRVKEVVQFYSHLLAYRRRLKESENTDLMFDEYCIGLSTRKSQFRDEDLVKAFCVSLYLNYVYRIFSDGRRYLGV